MPAYWFLSAWLLVRDAAFGALRQLLDFFRELRVGRRSRREAAAEILRNRSRVTTVDPMLLEAWNNSLFGGLAGLQMGARKIEHARDLAATPLKRVELLGRKLERMPLSSAEVPQVPPFDQALAGIKHSRGAVVSLVTALILLLPIAVANAQLTGLVLSEFIPPVQPLLGVPIPFVLAVVLVVAEAGIGLLHSAESERLKDSARRLSIGLVVWSVVACGVVALETLLYSQVNAGDAIPLLESMGSVFGLMGFVLGAVVFGLGRLAHSSLATMRTQPTPRVVAKQLVRLRDAVGEWNDAAGKLVLAQRKAAQGCQELAAACQGVAESERQSLDSFRLEVLHSAESPPQWAVPKDRPMTDAEFGERESGAFLWSAVATLSTVSLTVLAVAFASRLALEAAVALGLAAALLAFSVGALAARATQKRVALRIGLWIALWLIVAAAVGVVGRMLRGQVNAYSLLLLVPATAGYVAGLMAGGQIALLRLPVFWFTDVLSYLACSTAVVVAALLAAVVSIVEYAARVVAWPTSRFVDVWLTRTPNASAQKGSAPKPI